MQKRILIVDDEPAIRDMVAFALRKGEYEPVHAGDAREAAAAIAERVPDLILLDWMLPGISGLELARRWRKDDLTRDVPDHHADRPRRGKRPGQRPGSRASTTTWSSPSRPANCWPASRPCCAARAKTKTTVQRDSRWTAHRRRRAPRVYAGDQPVHVGPTEYRLLHFFMTHAERVYTRTQLLDHVWGGNVYVEERTVDVHIRRLRKALEPTGLEDMVQTVRGSGYRFSASCTA